MLLITGNVFLFFLPILYWIIMTVILRNTEEIWLREKFGKEYELYCRRVNRCWPWFPQS